MSGAFGSLGMSLLASSMWGAYLALEHLRAVELNPHSDLPHYLRVPVHSVVECAGRVCVFKDVDAAARSLDVVVRS